jgi:hypothetical protein
VDTPNDVIEELKLLCRYAESFPDGKERQFVLKEIRGLLRKTPELLQSMPEDLHEALGRLLNWH